MYTLHVNNIGEVH